MENSDYKDWEIQVEKATKNNNKLFIEFEKWLKNKSLNPKTIKSHIENIKFYGNNFLLRYEIIPVEEGALEIGNFLGDYFIRKTSWASKYTIQENIASFKKFYAFLNEIGKTSNTDLMRMKDLIKEEKIDWIEEVENYWNDIKKKDW